MQETLPIYSFNRGNQGLGGFQMAKKQQHLYSLEVPTSVKHEETIKVAQTNMMGESGKEQLDLDPLPAKVLENCQRTGRVIIISELEKRLNKDKKHKMELHKILSEFVPKRIDEEVGEYAENKKYYQSVNYSRVRIGHKQFIKKILNNSIFHKFLTEIFDSDSLYSSQKARKNERSPISFEKRKQILEKVLLDYKAKFLCLDHKQQCFNESSTILESCNILEEKEEVIQIEVPSFKYCPLIPIPLNPREYQRYMSSKKPTN